MLVVVLVVVLPPVLVLVLVLLLPVQWCRRTTMGMRCCALVTEEATRSQ